MPWLQMKNRQTTVHKIQHIYIFQLIICTRACMQLLLFCVKYCEIRLCLKLTLSTWKVGNCLHCLIKQLSNIVLSRLPLSVFQIIVMLLIFWYLIYSWYISFLDVKDKQPPISYSFSYSVITLDFQYYTSTQSNQPRVLIFIQNASQIHDLHNLNAFLNIY